MHRFGKMEYWNTEKAIFQDSIIPGENFYLAKYFAKKAQN
jgi:hypothetical protein